MDIKGFIPTSLIEWEGKIASVLFLPNCNLRCRYCHAGQLVCHPDQVDTIPRQEVFDYLRGQRDWLDGVVITGGEPTLHGEDLRELIGQVHWLDGVVITGGEPTLHGEDLRELIGQVRAVPLDVMIETNGTRPEWVGRLLTEGALAAVAMDLKAPLTAADYARVTAAEVDVNDVRQSLRLIRDSGLPHEFRITLVPGLVGRDELERMAPELDGADVIALQNFKPELCLDPALHKVTPYPSEELDALAEIVRPHARRVVVRGRDAAALAAARPDTD